MPLSCELCVIVDVYFIIVLSNATLLSLFIVFQVIEEVSIIIAIWLLLHLVLPWLNY